MDVPIVRRRDNATMLLRRATADRVRLERVESQRILRPMWLTKAISKVNNGTRRQRGFELIGEHALPTDFGH